LWPCRDKVDAKSHDASQLAGQGLRELQSV